MPNGTVKFFNTAKGFGFLSSLMRAARTYSFMSRRLRLQEYACSRRETE
jgi:hypothetical protein